MDTLSDSTEIEETTNRPSPKDFEAFIPWACFQFQVEVNVIVTKSEQGAYTSPFTTDRKDKKVIKAKDDTKDVDSKEVSKDTMKLGMGDQDQTLHIEAVYNQNNQLVTLKLKKNRNVPRQLLKIISLIVHFYPYLTTIIIDSGLRCDGLYELSKIVSMSKVTEVVLDNTVILEANYYLFLERYSCIKYLSLARCKLNDDAVEALASKLHISPLSILNLSSNRITDVGAKHLGNVLRSNRKLTYLNLAGNMITDVGAAGILNCLKEFPLSDEEITETKTRHFAYLKEKQEFIMKKLNELRTNINTSEIEDPEKKTAKRKVVRRISATTQTPKRHKGLEKEQSLRNLLQSVPNVEAIWYEKAEEVANASFRPFQNPYSLENTVFKDGATHCLGNNVLCYLNLAYNNLSYFSIKKLYEVLIVQEDLRRVPRGLINVSIDGNSIPVGCPELTEIDFILQSGMATLRKESAIIRRKTVKNIK